MEGQNKDTLFSPLVSMDSQTADKLVNKTSQESHDVLSRINDIDSEEKELYNTLLKVSDDIREIKEVQLQGTNMNENTNNTLKSQLSNLLTLQSNIRKQIDSLGKMRIQLYKDLGDKYVDLQTVVGESRNDLVDQRTVSDIMGGELNELKHQYGSLAEERNRKSRLTEIDTYYGKRYKSYSEFMKLIAYMCIPLLAVSVIFRMNYISDSVRNGIVMVVMIVGGYLVFMKGIDIWYRDNMNWDEYRWSGVSPGETVWEYDKRQLNKMWGERGGIMNDVSKLLGFACVNENCCKHPNIKWDKSSNTCVMKKKGKKNNKSSDSKQSGSGVSDSSPIQDGFAPMHPAPMRHSGKSLNAHANTSCDVTGDLGNLTQNYCGGSSDASDILGFDGF